MITPNQLRLKLSTVLPAYMLPARWMELRQLPKNANGKIDRRKLQEGFALDAANRLHPEPAEPGNINGGGTPNSSLSCCMNQPIEADFLRAELT